MPNKSFLRSTAKVCAQQTLGRLPPPAFRFTGPLATSGGAPVRDLRLRPWKSHADRGLLQWMLHVGPACRRIFMSGVEGTPQPLASRFAQQWARHCGCRFALLLPHGTDALRFGLAAALDHDGLDYGGEVIVPNVTFIASAAAALDRRFGVALVDVEPGTLSIDPRRVEEAIVPGKTRAILPVHLFGQPADMTALRKIALQYGLKIIEDAAQAHDAVWESQPVGSWGDAAGFSFQSFKNLSCGEGGALTTNDEALFARAHAFHNVGRARVGAERWHHKSLGWNCRPSEYQAAILLHRLRSFERLQARRRQNFFYLHDLLKDISCVEPLVVQTGVSRHGAHMFAMRYKREQCGGLSVDDFLEACGAEGAPIYRGYDCTLSEQPAIRDLLAKRPEFIRVLPTPVADQAVHELIYIPQEILLAGQHEMQDIAACIRKVQRYYAAGKNGSSDDYRDVQPGVATHARLPQDVTS